VFFLKKAAMFAIKGADCTIRLGHNVETGREMMGFTAILISRAEILFFLRGIFYSQTRLDGIFMGAKKCCNLCRQLSG